MTKVKTAIVGLNSLYICGETTFMFHLANNNDADIYAVNHLGSRLENDAKVPSQYKGNFQYIKEKDLALRIKDYDIIIFASLKWNGEYEYLEWLEGNNIRVIMHNGNENRFEDLGFDSFYRIIENENRVKYYSVDEAVDLKYKKWGINNPTRIKLPFSRELMPVFKEERNQFKIICPTRISPSKNVPYVLKIVEEYNGDHLATVHVFGNIENGKPHVMVHRYENCGFEDLAWYYATSSIAVDGSIFIPSPNRVQYTFLEAAFYGCAYLCDKSFFCDEVQPEVTCLELTADNVKKILLDPLLGTTLSQNAYDVLMDHQSNEVFRSIVG